MTTFENGNKKDIDYLTIADLKRTLRIGNSAAYRLCKTRSFPSIYLSGKWLISRPGLEEWLIKVSKMPDKGASVLSGK